MYDRWLVEQWRKYLATIGEDHPNWRGDPATLFRDRHNLNMD
jgi:hypothetical protein